MFDTVVYQLMRYFWFWLVTAQDIDVSSWLIVICCVVGKGETWDTSKELVGGVKRFVPRDTDMIIWYNQYNWFVVSDSSSIS